MKNIPTHSVFLALMVFPNMLLAEWIEERSERFDRLGPSQGNFGGVGLMQMPTARMAREGELSVNYADNEQYRRWSVSVQPYSWLEVAFRYTDVRTRLYSQHPGFSGDQSYKDKGIDFKLRLLDEGFYQPQLALGFRDFTGTGLFDSEYLVASKRWGDVDFTLGIGWGNLAERGNLSNPLCNLADAWCERESGYSGSGGKFEYKNLFHGPAAVFAGLEYQTPWQPLRLKLEYDGNDYQNEFAGRIRADSPLNIGAVYRVSDMLDTELSYQRGNQLMWGFTLRTNLTDFKPLYQSQPSIASAHDPVHDLAVPAQREQLRRQLDEQAGVTHSRLQLDESGTRAVLTGEQYQYRDQQDADKKTTELLANALPETVTQLTVQNQREGLLLGETRVDLPSWRQQQHGIALGELSPEVFTHQLAKPYRFAREPVWDKPAFGLSYGWKPQVQQSLGGPDSFYLYQAGISGSADLKWHDKWQLGGTLYWNWFDNYDHFNYKAPPMDSGAIPRVRTWVREYVTESNLQLSNLQLTWLDKLADNWYGQVYGGYLETMFAGVGTEMLYRPYGATWAIGADINYAGQRDWHNSLHLTDYRVTTGHLTGYWQLPWLADTHVAVSAGRYLAGDKGMTLNLTRRFANGIQLGAFATKTNVSSSEYGEGSFNKGLYITIPMDLLLVNPSTQSGTISWVPLTRDGGQMLGRRFGLYTLTDSTQF